MKYLLTLDLQEDEGYEITYFIHNKYGDKMVETESELEEAPHYWYGKDTKNKVSLTKCTPEEYKFYIAGWDDCARRFRGE